MRGFGICAAFAAALATAPAASDARVTPVEPEDAKRAYVRAVETMRALASPPYATYRSEWQSTGLGFDFTQDENRIVIDVGVGSTFRRARSYTAAYRGADRTLNFSDAEGERLVGRAHLLEPTWAGAYDILRYGLRGYAPDAVASESPAATDADVANVTAIAPLNYRVYDAGVRPCAALGDGRALHLVSRRGVQQHPLTDVVLDPASGRFCSMTFVVKDSGLAGVTGHYTIDFAPFGDYWLVTDGTIDVNVRFFGIAAKHATLRWTIADLATPETLPEATFGQ